MENIFTLFFLLLLYSPALFLPPPVFLLFLSFFLPPALILPFFFFLFYLSISFFPSSFLLWLLPSYNFPPSTPFLLPIPFPPHIPPFSSPSSCSPVLFPSFLFPFPITYVPFLPFFSSSSFDFFLRLDLTLYPRLV